MLDRCDASRLAAVAYGILITLVYVYAAGPAIAERFGGRYSLPTGFIALAVATVAYILSVLVALGLAEYVCSDEETRRALDG